MKSVHFGIVMKNTKAMKVFYAELLETSFSLEDSENGYAEIELEHLSSINMEPGESVKEDLPNLAHITHFLRIEVKDLKELVKTLKARGVIIIREPKVMTYGKIECYILDPDGNAVQLFQKV
jgi:predicted enzyme related to lactoylglutathione lyase